MLMSNLKSQSKKLKIEWEALTNVLSDLEKVKSSLDFEEYKYWLGEQVGNIEDGIKDIENRIRGWELSDIKNYHSDLDQLSDTAPDNLEELDEKN